MMVQEYAVIGDASSLSKTTWYTYNCGGNVTRVVSRDESGGAASAVGGGKRGSLTGLASEAGASGGVGTASLGLACSGNKKQYTATRFEYAKNGRTVTHAVGEQWCWDDSDVNNPTTDYTVTWGHQFLYDGARQRYLDVELDPVQLTVGNIAELSRTETDYDGNQPYRSTRTDAATGASSVTGYELGLARIDDMTGTPSTSYYHTDMLGTTRFTADASGTVGEAATYTAFGERITGPTNRFGYVGAFGYQNTKSATGAEEMPYLHVGARYYDPAIGRFLQRDPIGGRGGLNVYAYVFNRPTVGVDPLGRGFWSAIGGAIGGIIGGAITGAITGGGIPGAIGGAIAGGISGAVSGGLGGGGFGGGLVSGGINGAIAGIGGGIAGGLAGSGASAGKILGGSVIGGAVSGGIGSAVNGGSAGQIAAGTVAGGLSGLLGGMAGQSGQATLGCVFAADGEMFGAAIGRLP